MSIMADEGVLKARASAFGHRNSRTRSVCNLTRLNERFPPACDLDTGCLHTAYSHVRNMQIGVCNANAHSPWARNVKTGEARVVNVLSQNRHIGRYDPGAVERRADHRNTAPQM